MFPYGKDPFPPVSDIDFVKRWGGLHGFMLAYGINPNDSDAIVRAGQLVTTLRKPGVFSISPRLPATFAKVEITWEPQFTEKPGTSGSSSG